MKAKELIPVSFRNRIKDLLELFQGKKNLKEIRLSQRPRFKAGITDLIQPSIEYVDAASLLSAYREIFKNEIYKFKCNGSPRIIDCGANIGIAIIYWKSIYPNAKITAFEPDPNIFKILRKNIERQKFSDISLIQKGVFVEDGELNFFQEGADGGFISNNKNLEDENFLSVPVVDLKNYLNSQIDFLKIDIEGAEVEVIKHCEERLSLVNNLFVEYHSYPNSEQELGELLFCLKKAGFRYHLKPDLVAKQPFIEISENNGMDHRLNIFAYR